MNGLLAILLINSASITQQNNFLIIKEANLNSENSISMSIDCRNEKYTIDVGNNGLLFSDISFSKNGILYPIKNISFSNIDFREHLGQLRQVYISYAACGPEDGVYLAVNALGNDGVDVDFISTVIY